jgi:hypothetical protein
MFLHGNYAGVKATSAQSSKLKAGSWKLEGKYPIRSASNFQLSASSFQL